jgi:hypothetical protein
MNGSGHIFHTQMASDPAAKQLSSGRTGRWLFDVSDYGADEVLKELLTSRYAGHLKFNDPLRLDAGLTQA